VGGGEGGSSDSGDIGWGNGGTSDSGFSIYVSGYDPMNETSGGVASINNCQTQTVVGEEIDVGFHAYAIAQTA
jgi:hypothetical protein